VLDSFKEDLNKMFVYYVSKISKSLEDEKKLILDAGKPSQEYLKYESKKRDVLNTFGVKDEHGKLKEIDGKYNIILEKKEEFQKEWKDLIETFKEEIDKRKKELVEFTKFLEEDVEINIDKIPLKLIPEIITKEKMDILLSIIKEEV
jgi:predicted transcriptional regulator